MKRHWHVLYGTMIILFIACAIAIPSQSVPWVLTAIMTCTAMMWHRECIFARQMCEAWADSAERWHEVACNAMEERDGLIERARDEETNRDIHALKLHAKSPANFPNDSAHTPSPFGEALAEMYRHARPHTRPLIQTDHHGERNEP